MKNNIVFLFVVFLISMLQYSCLGKGQDKVISKAKKESSVNSVADSKVIYSASLEDIYFEKVNVKADSLNNWSAGEKLPWFLEKRDLDREYVHCYLDRNVMSFRKDIFDKVTNKKVLLEILGSDKYEDYPPQDINKCEPDKTNEYLYMSIAEIAKIRLSKL